MKIGQNNQMLSQHSQSGIGLFNQYCSRHLLAGPLEACELEPWTLKRPIVQTIFEESFLRHSTSMRT